MFEGMQNLTSLRTLMIIGCPSLVSLPPSIKHLPVLETQRLLVIGDCERLNLRNEDGNEEGSIQGSHSRLLTLVMFDLQKLEALLQWFTQWPAATTLHILVIARCHSFKALPESLEHFTCSVEKVMPHPLPVMHLLPLLTKQIIHIQPHQDQQPLPLKWSSHSNYKEKFQKEPKKPHQKNEK